MNVGIIGLGTYIAKNRIDAKEISERTGGNWSAEAVEEKLGIKSLPIATQEEGTQAMGAIAAQRAVDNAGIDPLEIDVVLGIGEEWKEYPLTTSALYIQDKIGAKNAWGIDVQNRCCTAITAMKMAKDMLIADDSIDTILVAGGYRNGDFIDYKDNDVSFMYNLGAGAGAIILRKGVEKNLLLGSKIIADASLARTAGVEIGGIANPFTCENLEEGKKSLRLMDAKFMKSVLNEVSLPNWFKCVDDALAASDMSRKDIDYAAILHMKRSAHFGILKELGLKDDQSIYLEDFGHIGQMDQILSLELALKSGQVKDGSVIVSLAAGIGYVWAANVIRWG